MKWKDRDFLQIPPVKYNKNQQKTEMTPVISP